MSLERRLSPGPWFVDTGFVVALVNAADPAHAACAEAWKTVRGPFLLTEGVLVESAHLLRRNPAALPIAWRLLRSVDAAVVALTPLRMSRCLELMDRWRDVPMDFVDATLVALAEEVGVTKVLTLDRRGFGAYRVGQKRFTVLP